ncbi:conserved hypothetical protein [Methanosalsum zhilinae DSM 4017]|uniref:DUF427 domain-containing protein n=1 Tax=Methanosalsum zhilinae (strain DSM 4017 / NBRC 107636 / OCM 62 / WeN5) TaxID=679901 RepID=F7XQI3_METZD|nr:DUF427 domain-containing protein [Methanosalsum zhilinae]AEH60484.1 conserved hypothetical protein [Methanosalsum zhilinae DSM 4017]
MCNVRLSWKIKWNNALLGKTKDFVFLDRIKYFLRDDLNMEYLKENDHHTTDDRGQIKYYDIVVDGKVYKNGAWSYMDYQTYSKDYSNYIAFDEDVYMST